MSGPYYALRREEQGARARLQAELAVLDVALERQPFLTGSEYGLADIAYLPWIVRARQNLGVELEPYPELSGWVERLARRPAVAQELAVVAAL